MCDFVKKTKTKTKTKTFNVGLYSDIYRVIYFKLGMMIDTKLYISDISFDDHYIHLRSQLYEKSKTLVSIFLEILHLR